MSVNVGTLEDAITGRVVRPHDAHYDEARSIWNAMIDKRPAAIVQVAGNEDVAAAIRFAREHDLELAIRGGGHGVAGNALTDGGIVIDLSGLRGVNVDPTARRATAQGGVTLGEFDAATQQHGLATTVGAVSLTGIAGLTLGGGLGWLMRKHGLACDNLVSAELVTAEGEVVTAGPDEPELLWALRGGGGNFGVVTSFEYALHEVSPIVYGGLLAFPAERGAEIVADFRDWATEIAPSDLGVTGIFTVAPPLPFVPAEVQGSPIFAVGVCWTGDHADGERIVQPMRDLGPVLDVVGPIPYVQLQQMFDAGFGPGGRSYWKAGYLPALHDDAIETLVNGAGGAAPTSVIECQVLGGAFAEGAEGSAFGNRDAKFLYNIVAHWHDAADDVREIGWTRGFYDAMELHATGGVYVNYMTADEGDRVRAGYGDERYERLRAIKRQYDPENVFHLNANIRPA